MGHKCTTTFVLMAPFPVSSWFSSSTYSGTEPMGISSRGFSGLDALPVTPPTNSVEASKETQSTEPNLLSASTARLLSKAVVSFARLPRQGSGLFMSVPSRLHNYGVFWVTEQAKIWFFDKNCFQEMTSTRLKT